MKQFKATLASHPVSLYLKDHLAPNVLRALILVLLLGGGAALAAGLRSYKVMQAESGSNLSSLLTSRSRVSSLEQSLASAQAEIEALRLEDQRVRNDQLTKDMTATRDTYLATLKSYEAMVDLREGRGKSSSMDKTFAQILRDLSDQKYASAQAQLGALDKSIVSETAKLATAVSLPISAPVNNTPPGSGYSRQKVQSSAGEFVVDIIAADLNSTKVVIDTASDSTCGNACPVLPLATYVSRSGAFAGVNGTYFCPESYPSCAGKTNSFDLLVMNKNKAYFNSDNNVYSQNPVAIFSAGSARFLSKAQEWGRDTGVDGVISNFPLLLINGQVQFGGSSDPKLGSRGNRSFLGSKGATVYIGVARNVTVAENALVLKALGLDHAMNLDSGGSTALWFGGYKAGPGRSIPNAVLFVRR